MNSLYIELLTWWWTLGLKYSVTWMFSCFGLKSHAFIWKASPPNRKFCSSYSMRYFPAGLPFPAWSNDVTETAVVKMLLNFRFEIKFILSRKLFPLCPDSCTDSSLQNNKPSKNKVLKHTNIQGKLLLWLLTFLKM